MTPEEAITKIRRGVLSIEEADEIEALLLSKIEKRAEPAGLTPKQQVLVDALHSFFCQDTTCKYIQEASAELTWLQPDHKIWTELAKRYADRLEVDLDQLCEILILAKESVDHSKISGSKWKVEVLCLLMDMFRSEVSKYFKEIPAFVEVP